MPPSLVLVALPSVCAVPSVYLRLRRPSSRFLRLVFARVFSAKLDVSRPGRGASVVFGTVALGTNFGNSEWASIRSLGKGAGVPGRHQTVVRSRPFEVFCTPVFVTVLTPRFRNVGCQPEAVFVTAAVFVIAVQAGPGRGG